MRIPHSAAPTFGILNYSDAMSKLEVVEMVRELASSR